MAKNTVPLSRTREVLVEAAGLIVEGWTQGRSRCAGCCFSPIGAIAEACKSEWTSGNEDGLPLPPPVFHAAIDVLTSSIGGGSLNLWNSAPNRTKAEVLDAFNRAIAMCGEQSR